ncbi:MAG: hypothetical protein H0U76_26315 [Ktedonobacteraceae bacterium]|nr:hypothetical protein [Ktedonobacteraceae bacterium]
MGTDCVTLKVDRPSEVASGDIIPNRRIQLGEVIGKFDRQAALISSRVVVCNQNLRPLCRERQRPMRGIRALQNLL